MEFNRDMRMHHRGAGRRRRVKLVTAVLVVVVAVLAGSTSAARPSFVALDLGTLGGSFSYATAVSASGQVVGYSTTLGDVASHAFSWTEAGGMVDLGTLGGSLQLRHGGQRRAARSSATARTRRRRRCMRSRGQRRAGWSTSAPSAARYS